MDSKTHDDDRSSGSSNNGSGDGGGGGGIIPPPPQPAWASAINGAATHRKMDDDDDSMAAASIEEIRPVASVERVEECDEEKGDEVEDDDAPIPPETVAASFEDSKPPLVYDDCESARSDQIAASVKGGESDEAQSPPEMITASFEAIDTTDREAKRKPFEVSACDLEKNINSTQDYIDSIRREIAEVFDDDGTIPVTPGNPSSSTSGPPPNTSVSTNPSVLEREQRSFTVVPTSATDVRVGSFSSRPTSQISDYHSLPVGDQGDAEVSIGSTENLPVLDPFHHSLPLLVATCVDDEEVFEAFPVNDTRDDAARGLLRRKQR
jgi:hypothetical protein